MIIYYFNYFKNFSLSSSFILSSCTHFFYTSAKSFSARRFRKKFNLSPYYSSSVFHIISFHSSFLLIFPPLCILIKLVHLQFLASETILKRYFFHRHFLHFFPFIFAIIMGRKAIATKTVRALSIPDLVL